MTEAATERINAELSLDVVFEMLRNQRRRQVLRYLTDHDDDSVQLGDLAEHIAAAENDKPVADVTSKERKRVYVGLYQLHLPKMDDAGAISYTQRPGVVESTDTTERIYTYLDPPDTNGTRWERYYGALAVVTLAAFVGIVAGVVPDWVSPIAVLGVVSVAVGLCSVAQFASSASHHRSPE